MPAQDVHHGVDLVGRLALAAGVQSTAGGSDGERHAAEPADNAADLPPAENLGHD